MTVSDLNDWPEGAEYRSAGNLSRLKGISHGFFTRRGGVSEGIYGSLNCGFGSGDRPESVARNRILVAEKLGVPARNLITPRQIHSATAYVTSRAWDVGSPPSGDAVVTAQPGLAVAVLTADCAPVLLADPEAGVVAAVHAGWKGALAGVLSATVGAMEEIGASRDRIVAAIGPTISSNCYEVGPEFRDAFLSDKPASASFFAQVPGKSRPCFDLPSFVKAELAENGVEQVEDLQSCTYENESLFFSSRRAVHRGDTDYGRQISAIVIS